MSGHPFTGTTEVLTFPDSPDLFRVTDYDAANVRTWEVLCIADRETAVCFADVWARSYGRELRLGNVVSFRQALAERRRRA